MIKETTAQIQFVRTRETADRSPMPVINYESFPAKKQWNLITAVFMISGFLLFVYNPAILSAGTIMMITGAALVMIRFFYSLFNIDIDISSLDLSEDDIMKDLDW